MGIPASILFLLMTATAADRSDYGFGCPPPLLGFDGIWMFPARRILGLVFGLVPVYLRDDIWVRFLVLLDSFPEVHHHKATM